MDGNFKGAYATQFYLREIAVGHASCNVFFSPWRLMYLVGAGMYMNQTTSLRGLSSQPAKNFAAYHLGKIKIKGYMPWNFFNMIYIYIYKYPSRVYNCIYIYYR